jgi:CheY-like chemotaxis protein
MAKILIIDDSKLLQMRMMDEMEKCGYHVLPVSDAIEAFMNIKTYKPDLILLDIMLPDMNGWEVCRRMKGDPDVAQIPIVMLSALDGAGDRQKALDLGASAYVVKPGDNEKGYANLRDIVKNLLGE